MSEATKALPKNLENETKIQRSSDRIRLTREQALGFLFTFLGTGQYSKPKSPESVAWLDCMFGHGCWPTPELIENWGRTIRQQSTKREDVNQYVRKVRRMAELFRAVADGLFHPTEADIEDMPADLIDDYMDSMYVESDERQERAIQAFKPE